MGVGPVVCRCTSGWASPKCGHGGSGQPRSPRLASCIHIATEAHTSYRPGSRVLAGVEEVSGS